MSFLTDIFSKFFKTNTTATSNLSTILDGLAAKSPDNLDWRDSIVDLMKLFGIVSSLDNREKLARQLDFSGDLSDTATMNIFLQNRMIITIVENHAVDVVAILDDLAAKNSEKLDWRDSVGDLMKLFGMDSSRAAREKLAMELGYTGHFGDSAMNMSLHTRLMIKIVDNGGKLQGAGTGGETEAPAPLDNSGRHVLKGTLVPLAVRREDRSNPGLLKFAAVRQLALTAGDADRVREHLDGIRDAPALQGERPVSNATFDLLRSFEAPLVPALRPGIADAAAVPTAQLIAFSQALVDMRTREVQALDRQRTSPLHAMRLMQALNTAAVAAELLRVADEIQPIGMLNLERIEMVPAGIERGELVSTIPLAPGEETAVIHKEWSVTSKEFTTIVTDSLEEFSETGVTDNTDLSQSTASQTQHSNQFNITGTVQGGIPIISGSSSVGFTAQDASSQSATESIKHATSITQKASSRSRQEHKTTISTITVTGTEETSTRKIKNSSPTDPIRIDYFSLMRKWRVRLYRFGLRMTYDIVLPEPGASMRRAYMDLDLLRKQIGPFTFSVKYSDITTEPVDSKGNPVPPNTPGSMPKYRWLADEYGAAVKPFPTAPAPKFENVSGPGNRNWHFLELPFDVPVATQISEMFLSAQAGDNQGTPILRVIGAQRKWENEPLPFLIDEKRIDAFNPPGTPFMAGATGHQKVVFFLDNTDTESITLKILVKNDAHTEEQWRTDVWNALYNAALARYQAQQQEILGKIAAIEDKLANVDTLTLRREESDEIMKNVLKFVVGTDFEFMPDEVKAVFKEEATDLDYGVAFDKEGLNPLNSSQWTVLGKHQEMVRFVNQAIEWENVASFLYPYFWDVPQSWAFIRDLRHPDATRQAFLRAGSARVVLTVRKGWESRWKRFVEDETILAEEEHPTTGHLSIAQEIAAYDDRNYPGIPPANPARAAVRLHDAVYTTSTAQVGVSETPVSIEVASSAGLVKGANVVIDVENEKHIQETAVVVEVPDATHIVVDALTHPHNGSVGASFPVLQPGERGALIAEWNEYTPSSGIDIAVTSNLHSIA